MVALLRLLAPPQELVELLLGRPDRPVDALEHRALLVAAPVRAGDREQLERPDRAGGRDVRSLAQVDEGAVLVDRGRRHRRAVALGLRGQVVEDLHLERLVALGEEGAALGRRQLAPDERVVGGDAGGHPGLDRGQVVRGERAGQLEVVVEAVRDGRTDAELRAREEVQHRLGHHVRRRVAHRVEVAVRAGIEQLVGGPAFGRLEPDLDRRFDLLVRHRASLLEKTKPLTGRDGATSPPSTLSRWMSGCGGRHWTRTSDLLHVKQVL